MPSQTSLSAQPSKLLFGDRQRERRMTTQPNPFISREGATKPNPSQAVGLPTGPLVHRTHRLHAAHLHASPPALPVGTTTARSGPPPPRPAPQVALSLGSTRHDARDRCLIALLPGRHATPPCRAAMPHPHATGDDATSPARRSRHSFCHRPWSATLWDAATSPARRSRRSFCHRPWSATLWDAATSPARPFLPCRHEIGRAHV